MYIATTSPPLSFSTREEARRTKRDGMEPFDWRLSPRHRLCRQKRAQLHPNLHRSQDVRDRNQEAVIGFAPSSKLQWCKPKRTLCVFCLRPRPAPGGTAACRAQRPRRGATFKNSYAGPYAQTLPAQGLSPSASRFRRRICRAADRKTEPADATRRNQMLCLRT